MLHLHHFLFIDTCGDVECVTPSPYFRIHVVEMFSVLQHYVLSKIHIMELLDVFQVTNFFFIDTRCEGAC